MQDIIHFKHLPPTHHTPKFLTASTKHLLVSSHNTLFFLSLPNLLAEIQFTLPYTITAVSFYNDNILLIGTLNGLLIVYSVQDCDFYEIDVGSITFVKNICCYEDRICVLFDDDWIYEIEVQFDSNSKFNRNLDNKNKIENKDKLNLTYDCDIDYSSVLFKDFSISQDFSSFKSSSKVTSIQYYNKFIIFTDSKGYIRFISFNNSKKNKNINDSEIIKEFYVNDFTFISISAYKDHINDRDLLVLVSEQAYVILIDIDNEVILDMFKATDHTPLISSSNNFEHSKNFGSANQSLTDLNNSKNFENVNNYIYVSGHDSRVFCINILDSKLTKLTQTDTHFNDVISLCCMNNKVYSLSLDKSIGVYYFYNDLDPKNTDNYGKIGFKRFMVYDQVGKNKNEYIGVNKGNSLDIYKIIVNEKVNLNTKNELKENTKLSLKNNDNLIDSQKDKNIEVNKITDIKFDEKIDRKSMFINYFEKEDYDFLTSFKSKEKITNFDFTKDAEIVVYSSFLNTKIYKKIGGKYKLIKKEVPSNKIAILGDSVVLLLTYSNSIILLKDESKNENNEKLNSVCLTNIDGSNIINEKSNFLRLEEIKIKNLNEIIINTNKEIILVKEMIIITNELKIRPFRYTNRLNMQLAVYDFNNKIYYVLESENINQNKHFSVHNTYYLYSVPENIFIDSIDKDSNKDFEAINNDNNSETNSNRDGKIKLASIHQILNIQSMSILKNKILMNDTENIIVYDMISKKISRKNMGGYVAESGILSSSDIEMQDKIVVMQIDYDDLLNKRKENGVVKWRNKIINKI